MLTSSRHFAQLALRWRCWLVDRPRTSLLIACGIWMCFS